VTPDPGWVTSEDTVVLAVGETRVSEGDGIASDPVIQEEVGLRVQESEVVEVDDDTGPADLVWDRRGQWGFSTFPARSRSTLMLVSRLINEEEVARNADRVASDGMCGWISLEWAARAADFPDRGLNPHVTGDRDCLQAFLASVASRATGAALAKIEGVIRHMQGATPGFLPKESGLWLGLADLEGLHLPFPLVVWGSDTGGGWRRVMYPSRWNMGVSESTVADIFGCEAQIVLDSAHYFPVDTVIAFPSRYGNRQRREPDKGKGKRIRQLDADVVLKGIAEVRVGKTRRRPQKVGRGESV